MLIYNKRYKGYCYSCNYIVNIERKEINLLKIWEKSSVLSA